MQVLAIAVSVATAVGFIWLLMTCPAEAPVDDDDWYDEDDWDDEDEGWRFQVKLSRLFRRHNAVLSNITESRVVDMDSAITQLDPDTSQFETLLSKMARVAAPVKIEWMEDELFPRLNPWEDWGFPSTWEDCPRKPKVQMTLAPQAIPIQYGTIVRTSDGGSLRSLGGDWWERLS